MNEHSQTQFAEPTIVCPRHGEIRPPMPMPYYDARGLLRCHCGRAMVPPSVKAHNDALMGRYLRD